MEKNTLLNISIFLCGLSRVIYAVLGVIILGFFIHIQINPSFYDDYYVQETTTENRASTDLLDLKIKEFNQIKWNKNTKAYKINTITTFSLYYTTAQLLAILALLYFAIREFQKVMESVKNLETFRTRNVKSFRRIGNFLLLIALISFYTHIAFNDANFTKFSINFKIDTVSLFTILTAFILAEIFKEGNKLHEENQLTV